MATGGSPAVQAGNTAQNGGDEEAGSTDPLPPQAGMIGNHVMAGALWAHFSCPRITSPPSGACKLEGGVVLENCGT